jgi:tetratricopeptide (TPR) repeat protein
MEGKAGADFLAHVDALMLAEQHRSAGRLDEAQALCRSILDAQPNEPDALHLLGLVALQLGELADAIEQVRRAVKLAPEVALYHATLGEMCRFAGRPEEAVAHGRRALDLKPDYPEALNNLGNALRAMNRLDEAECAVRRALEIEPRFVQAWKNLGMMLHELKRLPEAIEAYRKALAQSPNDPDTLHNMALATLGLGRLDEATELLRRALTIKKSDPKLFLHLGAMLIDQGEIEEAATALGQALALDPTSHDAINLMGRVAFRRGALDAGLAHYRHAVELKPDFSEAYNGMGNALHALGRFREAVDAYRNALALDPKNTSIYVNVADSKKFTEGDPQLLEMQAIERDDSLTPSERMFLHFALGKAFADLNDHARAFEHLLQGNALKRAQILYDEAATAALFERIEAMFAPALIKKKARHGERSHVPVFVLGMPRSGTTLVEQILASHPLVHGAGELTTMEGVMRTERAADVLMSYPDFVPMFDAACVKRIGARYLAEMRRIAPTGKTRVINKLPSNYLLIGLIHLALPNARIIHTIRDPVDTCISCFSKLFTLGHNYTYDLAELGRYYRRYQKLMAHWNQVLPQGRILDVRYEDVVADLESQARRIIAHCGLDWDERCLAFHQTERPVSTPSAMQVRQPIYNKSIGRWRVYEPFLRPLLAEL